MNRLLSPEDFIILIKQINKTSLHTYSSFEFFSALYKFGRTLARPRNASTLWPPREWMEIKNVINNTHAINEAILNIGELANFINQTTLVLANTIKRKLISSQPISETQN